MISVPMSFLQELVQKAIKILQFVDCDRVLARCEPGFDPIDVSWDQMDLLSIPSNGH